jgi:hypothetical protein
MVADATVADAVVADVVKASRSKNAPRVDLGLRKDLSLRSNSNNARRMARVVGNNAVRAKAKAADNIVVRVVVAKVADVAADLAPARIGF